MDKHNLYGPRQWAYQKKQGSRDTLAFLVMTWLLALCSKHKIVLYCSDVAGAFDRVNSAKLTQKLIAKGLYPDVVAVIVSWLAKRRAFVVVGGQRSHEIALEQMLFQGTALGPPLWNLFYEDVRRAVLDAGFQETVFADDLHAYKLSPSAEPNEKLLDQAGGVSSERS